MLTTRHPAEAGLHAPARAGLHAPAEAGLYAPARAGLHAPAEAGLHASRRVWLSTIVAPASCVVYLVCWLLNPGTASGQPAATLTAMDYVQIQQLVNRLNFALDYCGNGGRAFADLFVAGGRYVIDRGDGQPVVRDTRDALIALAGGPGCESRRTPPSSYILHLAESLVIEPTADGARGTSYAFYPSSAGKYLNADTAGQLGFYHDEYVRTPNGWRVRARRHELNPAIGSTIP